MREMYIPSDYVSIASNFNTMGTIRHDQANYDDAISLYQQALAIYEKYCPPHHLDIVICLSNIGVGLTNCGKYDEALTYAERVLAIHEKRIHMLIRILLVA
jgi:tetratricopeptide (TPR) repeat protein